jgi:hypothetical protein
MIEIKFFPKVNNRSVHSAQGLDRFLQRSTSSDKLKINTYLYQQWLYENPHASKSEKSKMKVYFFSAVAFGGTFSGTGKAEDINTISGLIVLDFDHIVDLMDIHSRLKDDPYTFLLFVSPSGDGLKSIVKHNLKDPQKWQYLFKELEAHYLHLFNGIMDKSGKQLSIDPSGKDINRMCFIPFMKDLYQNNESQEWQYTGEYEKQIETITPRINTQLYTTGNTDFIYKECFYLSAYLFENEINISDNYDDWLSYGYSLCTLGEQGREIFHNISCISDKYDTDECDHQYDYMLSHFDETRTNIYNFLNNAKRAIAHHAIYSKYGFLCS